MSRCSTYMTAQKLDQFIECVLPGTRIIETVRIRIDPECAILLDNPDQDPSTPQGRLRIPQGEHEGRVIQTPPGPKSERWIVIPIVASHDEGSPEWLLRGRTLAQWRKLTELRADFDLQKDSGEDYF